MGYKFKRFDDDKSTRVRTGCSLPALRRHEIDEWTTDLFDACYGDRFPDLFELMEKTEARICGARAGRTAGVAPPARRGPTLPTSSNQSRKDT
ncbi:hypothetical protein LP421_08445 [Rhizobium sp. RCAM05350]|nr:hypothetical protein LP421_08445 [Rhizobium sp. RCAM05350]